MVMQKSGKEAKHEAWLKKDLKTPNMHENPQ